MRTWKKSACFVLAWTILAVLLVAAGLTGSVHTAQASTRTESNIQVTLTRTPRRCAIGLPQWLGIGLVILGLVILAAFLAQRVLDNRRRRQQAAIQAAVRARRGRRKR